MQAGRRNNRLRVALIGLHVARLWPCVRHFAGLLHADDDAVIAFEHHHREGDRERAQPVGHLAFEDGAAEQQVADGIVGQDDGLLAIRFTPSITTLSGARRYSRWSSFWTLLAR